MDPDAKLPLAEVGLTATGSSMAQGGFAGAALAALAVRHLRRPRALNRLRSGCEVGHAFDDGLLDPNAFAEEARPLLVATEGMGGGLLGVAFERVDHR